MSESVSPSWYSPADKQHMTRAMRLSLFVGFFMFVIKVYAYFITGSAAILSDAAESVVHILAGEGDAIVGGAPRVVGPGTWFHMPARMPHSIRARTPLTMALYLLAPDPTAGG